MLLVVITQEDFIATCTKELTQRIAELKEKYCSHAYTAVEEISRAKYLSDSQKDKQLLETVPAMIAIGEALGYNALKNWAEGIILPVLERDGNKKSLDEFVEDAKSKPEVKKLLKLYELLGVINEKDDSDAQKHKKYIKPASSARKQEGLEQKMPFSYGKHTLKEISKMEGACGYWTLTDRVKEAGLKGTKDPKDKRLTLYDTTPENRHVFLRKDYLSGNPVSADHKKNPLPVNPKEGYLTLNEAAKEINYNPNSMFYLVSKKALRSELIDGHRLIPKSAIEEFKRTYECVNGVWRKIRERKEPGKYETKHPITKNPENKPSANSSAANNVMNNLTPQEKAEADRLKKEGFTNSQIQTKLALDRKKRETGE